MRCLLLLCLLRPSAALNFSSRSYAATTLGYSAFYHRNKNNNLIHAWIEPSLKSTTRIASAKTTTTLLNSMMDNLTPTNADEEWRGPTGESGSLERLCSISLRACQIMNPLISQIYQQLLVSLDEGNASSSEKGGSVKKLKQDKSAFTIADGLVQRFLIEVLYSKISFLGIVGEEEDGNGEGLSDESWFHVEGLTIPEELRPLVVSTKDEIEALALEYLAPEPNNDYQQLTVFIDPIDGTREFSTGKGEQCSVCIGFANKHGKAIGGVVYRPLSLPKPTWVAGAKSEGYAVYNFGGKKPSPTNNGGLLTTNGSISPFLGSLIEELQVERVKSGGAGNKMMLLLESSISDATNGSMLYIQDRGVSRWDTCAAEACLDSFGGALLKMTPFLETESCKDEQNDEYYTYLASQSNLDFIPGTSLLTKQNCRKLSEEVKLSKLISDIDLVKPYSNLCGLVAIGKQWNTTKGKIQLKEAMQRAAKKNPPSFS